MSIAKIMTRSVITAELDQTLAELQRIFAKHKFHHVLVVSKGNLVGVVSDRDLLKALSPNLGTAAETSRDLATLNKRIHQVMERELHTLTADASVYDAIDLFNSYKVSCIPIIDDANTPVGILSWRDIMRTIADMRAQKLKL